MNLRALSPDILPDLCNTERMLVRCGCKHSMYAEHIPSPLPLPCYMRTWSICRALKTFLTPCLFTLVPFLLECVFLLLPEPIVEPPTKAALKVGTRMRSTLSVTLFKYRRHERKSSGRVSYQQKGGHSSPTAARPPRRRAVEGRW